MVNLNTGLTLQIITEAERRGLSLQRIAYILATAHHETGGKMSPITENLNYSVDGLLKTFSRSRISSAQAQALGRIPGKRPANQIGIANTVYGGEWGRANLGNTMAGDGWRYRGAGLVQPTGRRNFAKLSGIVGLDLVASPEKALEPSVAVTALVIGMERGIYTGKMLSDYIGGVRVDYLNARRIVNGMDRAEDVADLALRYEAALVARLPVVNPHPAPTKPKPYQSPWAALVDAVTRFFKRS